MYTVEDFVSDVGGTVGLFLGLSLVELAFGFLDMVGRAASRTWMVIIFVKISSLKMTHFRLLVWPIFVEFSAPTRTDKMKLKNLF